MYWLYIVIYVMWKDYFREFHKCVPHSNLCAAYFTKSSLNNRLPCNIEGFRSSEQMWEFTDYEYVHPCNCWPISNLIKEEESCMSLVMIHPTLQTLWYFHSICASVHLQNELWIHFMLLYEKRKASALWQPLWWWKSTPCWSNNIL